jgi:hypothetical protein
MMEGGVWCRSPLPLHRLTMLLLLLLLLPLHLLMLLRCHMLVL